MIRGDGLVLTIGYLITEAEEVWLATREGRRVPAHVLAYDYASGFGLVQALGPWGRRCCPGDSRKAALHQEIVVGGAGGRSRSLAARIVARQEFAGYGNTSSTRRFSRRPPIRIGAAPP